MTIRPVLRQVAQADDGLKTADAMVSVTVEDVNDNAPQFDRRSYSATLPENSPLGAGVLKAVVTDLDQVPVLILGAVGFLKGVPMFFCK